MAHKDHAAAHASDDLFQPGQSVEVEIVGGLVEKDDVEAGAQQRRQAHARGLTSGETGHQRRLGCAGGRVESQLGEHRGQAFVEIRGSGREPMIQRRGVSLVPGPVGQRRRGRVHRGRRRRATGPSGHVLAHRLARRPLMLLRQPAHEGVRRRPHHRSLQRCEITGEDAEQRRLPGTVGADHPDHIAGRHREVEMIEQHPMGVPTGDVLGDERCGHRSIVASAGARSTGRLTGARRWLANRSTPTRPTRRPPRPPPRAPRMRCARRGRTTRRGRCPTRPAADWS